MFVWQVIQKDASEPQKDLIDTGTPLSGKGKSGKKASSSSTSNAKAHKISTADGSNKSLAKSPKKHQSDSDIFSVDSNI